MRKSQSSLRLSHSPARNKDAKNEFDAWNLWPYRLPQSGLSLVPKIYGNEYQSWGKDIHETGGVHVLQKLPHRETRRSTIRSTILAGHVSNLFFMIRTVLQVVNE